MVAGVDRTRPRYALPAGSIWSGINGHITRGGDFEKRKAFVAKYSLPTGTLGLQKTSAGLYVFGHAASPSMPTGVSYQRLEHPGGTGTAMTKLLSSDLYNGKIYAIAEYADDSIHHFYDGTVVADWQNGSGNYPAYTGQARGTIARTHQRKVYSPVGSVLWFSGVDTAIGWEFSGASLDPGAGYQNLSTHQGGSDAILGLVTYQNYLAAFSRRVIQIWDMQADEDNNAPVQTIPEAGTRANRSVVGFGDFDAFYLGDNGIRALRARTSINIAGINDVGTPIDTLVIDWMADQGDTISEDAIGLVEPVDGRFWMIIGTRIYVFSYFPTKKVAGWTWYEVDDLTFTDAVAYSGRIYCRADDDVIYLYGGDDNATYDDTVATLELPFMTAGKVGHAKQIEGIDIACSGEWNVKLLIDPRDETQYVEVGDIDGISYQADGNGALGDAHHVAPKLVSTGDGYASVSKVTVYFEGAEPKM